MSKVSLKKGVALLLENVNQMVNRPVMLALAEYITKRNAVRQLGDLYRELPQEEKNLVGYLRNCTMNGFSDETIEDIDGTIYDTFTIDFSMAKVFGLDPLAKQVAWLWCNEQGFWSCQVYDIVDHQRLYNEMIKDIEKQSDTEESCYA